MKTDQVMQAVASNNTEFGFHYKKSTKELNILKIKIEMQNLAFLDALWYKGLTRCWKQT